MKAHRGIEEEERRRKKEEQEKQDEKTKTDLNKLNKFIIDEEIDLNEKLFKKNLTFKSLVICSCF